MVNEDIGENDWLNFNAKNECFDFLNVESEDIYSDQDGFPLEQ
jgi:hypothetical protein